MLSLSYFIQTAHRAVEAATDAASRDQTTPAAVETWDLAERYAKMLMAQAHEMKARAVQVQQ